MDGLDVIAEGTNNKRFRKILAQINEEIRQGVNFGERWRRTRRSCRPYYLGIRAHPPS